MGKGLDDLIIGQSLLSGEIFSLRPHKKGVKKIGLEGVKKENSCSAVRYYYLLVSRTNARFYSQDGTCFSFSPLFYQEKSGIQASPPWKLLLEIETQ